jgi:hypothetical protein
LANGGWRKLEKEPAKGRPKERSAWIEALDKANVDLFYIEGAKNPADKPSRPPFVGLAATTATQRTKQEWAELQSKDSKLAGWFEYLKEDKLPKNKHEARMMAMEKPNYEIVDGVLKRRRVDHAHASRKEDQWLIMVPEAEKADVLKAFHEQAGHPSYGQMTKLIHQAGMDWQGLYNDCKEHRFKCVTCGEYTKINSKEGFQQPILKSELDEDVLQMDWIDLSRHETSDGYKYICVSVTMKDKWPELTAHKKMDSQETLEHLRMRASRESAWPKVVHDQGTPFIAEATETWLKEAGIKPRPTADHNPMANGGSEAEVHNVKRELVRLCAGDPEWAKHLDLTALYLRYKIRSDSGMSAYEMRFGKPMRLVQFLKYGADEPKSMNAAELQKHMKEIYRREDERAMKQKERYDKGRKEPKYKEGDKVWIKVNDAGLFDKKRRGPYVILEKISDLNYRIGEIGKEKLNKFSNVVNVKQIATYTPEVEDGEEWKVKKVLEHKEYRRKGLRFVIEWDTGEITEEPVDVFVDIVDGKRIWNEKVLKYAKKHNVDLDASR